MPKQYIKQKWIDDSEPDLEADNLNHIENGIDNLDTRVALIEDEGTASAIKDLKDVSLEGLTDGQILEYDAESEKWKNTTIETDGLVMAGEGKHLEISNIVESPFQFAIQDGIYGYLKKEADTDVFVPFNSSSLKCDVQYVDILPSADYTFEFDFDVKSYIIWNYGNNAFPIKSSSTTSSLNRYVTVGQVVDGVLNAQGYFSSDTTSARYSMVEGNKVTVHTTSNKSVGIMAFNDENIVDLLINGIEQQSEE